MSFYRSFYIPKKPLPYTSLKEEVLPNLEMDVVTVSFTDTNIRYVVDKKILDFEKDNCSSPNTLYINYEGYKAIIADISNEDEVNFSDSYLGLKIEIIPDNIYNGIYVEVAKRISCYETFREMMKQRSIGGKDV